MKNASKDLGFYVMVTNPRVENIIFKGHAGIEHGYHFWVYMLFDGDKILKLICPKDFS